MATVSNVEPTHEVNHFASGNDHSGGGLHLNQKELLILRHNIDYLVLREGKILFCRLGSVSS